MRVRQTERVENQGKGAACRALFALCAACLALVCCGLQTAWAVDSSAIHVGGIDDYAENVLHVGSESGSADAKVDILAVECPKDTTLYFDVYEADSNGNAVNYLVKRYAWKATGSDPSDMNNVAGNIRIDASLLDASVIKSGAYRIAVYWDNETRANPCVFSLHGVYAKLESTDGSEVEKEVLIGLRTFSVNERETERVYVAPDTIYETDDEGVGHWYSLHNVDEDLSTSLNLEYEYYEYDPGSSLEGVVVYVDDEGNTLRKDTVAGISDGVSRTYYVPDTITVKTDEGTLYYRTLCIATRLTLSYPTHIHYTIHCVPVSSQTVAAEESTPYTVNIRYMARTTNADGTTTDKLVLTDSLVVRKVNKYTPPESFFTTREDSAGNEITTTCTLNIDATMAANGEDAAGSFDPDTSVVTFMPADFLDSLSSSPLTTQTFTVVYDGELDQGSDALWTIYSWDASKSIGAAQGGERPTLLKKQTFTVAPGQTATWETEQGITGSDGKTLVPFGGTSYSYTNASGNNASPVTNVYYVEEGAEFTESYDVTVKYVDISTGKVLDTRTVGISPDITEDVEIPTGPESFTVDDTDYVRLAGQSRPFFHNYAAPYRTYCVYYRNVDDDVYANAVVTRTVVTETQSKGGAVNTPDGREVGLSEGDMLTRITFLNPTEVTEGETTTAEYAAADGEADGLLLNEEGIDTAEQREIDDNENPLAEGPGGAADEAASEGGVSTAAVAGIVAVVVVAALLAFFLVRRRKGKNDQAQSDAQ